MIATVRAATDRPFNVNVFCNHPAVVDQSREAAWLARLAPVFRQLGAEPPARLTEIYRSFVEDDAMLAVLLEERPRVVSFHFGLPPAERIVALRDAGIVLLATATNLEEARSIATAGVDAVVAQGFEAGGHRGVFDPEAHDDHLGTIALTRLLVRRLEIPVIAAGGIMDGAGIAACLLLGAGAAQLGTAFIACPESAADENYRAALLGDASGHTVITTAISGRPARCLANRFTALGDEAGRGAVPAYPIAYDAAKALAPPPKLLARRDMGPIGPAKVRRWLVRCVRRLWSRNSNPRWSRRSLGGAFTPRAESPPDHQRPACCPPSTCKTSPVTKAADSR